ncbi:MAG: sigma-70 family RNA polymerase sigma factor [Clostridia bacterium]|nr:sigma-70 family RNA polymerase sigma factor [Clostridia bacterium]
MENNQRNKNALLEDDKIVQLYWDRDESAIDETDKKYRNYLYTIAYNIVHDRLDCEECLNDTYLGTWNTIPPTRPNILQVFLAKIMRNVAVDKYRQNHASRRIPSELIVSLDEIDESMIYDPTDNEHDKIVAIAEALNIYLKGLSDRDQLIFVCRYYYADYITDIAKMLGVSEKTVSRALHNMRQELREALEKEGYTP